MKSAPRNYSSGFTLIELLVVIAIIALLAGMAVPAGQMVMYRARKLQASAAISGLMTAIKGYQTEYNRLPNTQAGGAQLPQNDQTVDTTSSTSLIQILMGSDKTNNPREVKFYEPQVAKNGLNGLTDTGDLVDPWKSTQGTGTGQPYHVTLDYDGNSSIANPVTAAGGNFGPEFMNKQPPNIPGSIAIYSDGDPNHNPREGITSW